LPDQRPRRLGPRLPRLPGPKRGHVGLDVHDGAELALEALEFGVDLGGVAHGPEGTPRPGVRRVVGLAESPDVFRRREWRAIAAPRLSPEACQRSTSSSFTPALP